MRNNFAHTRETLGSILTLGAFARKNTAYFTYKGFDKLQTLNDTNRISDAKTIHKNTNLVIKYTNIDCIEETKPLFKSQV